LPDGRHQLAPAACVGCGACARRCLADALQVTGWFYEPTELLLLLRRDTKYYAESGGGITFSGGEPLLFPAWLEETLARCKGEALSTAIDTAGNVPYEVFTALLPLTDLFLFDVKFFDARRHSAATGVSNERILANLTRLSEAGARVWVRIPVVAGYNADLMELRRIAEFLADLPGRAMIERVDLLPYHSYGTGKYESLGLSCELTGAALDAGFMDEALRVFAGYGLPAHST
jgi:pyruvate formate lyase activating enzyme